MVDTKRLKTDAAYWPECGAPEDATAAIENGWVKYDFDGVSESWFWWPFDHQMKQGWRKTLTQCDTYHDPFIPRPTNTEAPDWDGNGLPPVGCECEYTAQEYSTAHPSISPGHWYRCKIIAYHEGAVWTSDNGIRQLGNTRFRPIRTKEQRERDELVKKACEVITSGYSFYIGAEELANKLYDAGLLQNQECD